MTIKDITRDVRHMCDVISGFRESIAEVNSRLHGIEMRLLEERSISNKFLYERITELQKKILNGPADQHQ